MRCRRPPASRRGSAAFAEPRAALLACALLSCTAPPRHAGEALEERLEGLDRASLASSARRAMRAGERARARRRFEAMLARDPRDDEARAGIARLDAWDGELARAERAYRDVLSRHPGDDDVRAGLFDVLAWQGRWDDAAALLDEAAPPERPLLLACKARLERARGDLGQAHTLAERAERASGGDPEMRALRQRLSTGFVRVTARALAFSTPQPNLGQVDLEVSETFRRLVLSFETEHGQRPSSRDGGSAYGATWGGAATWLFGQGFSLGVEAAFGAPAESVPALSLRARGAAPILDWLSTSLVVTHRRYTGGIATNGFAPSVGFVLGGELRLDATYWLTHVTADEPKGSQDRRFVHAFSVAAGRSFLPWLALRAGFAHGAEAERSPALFQLVDLVSDTIHVGADLSPFGFLRVTPLYALTLRGRPGDARNALHTFELGAVVRW